MTERNKLRSLSAEVARSIRRPPELYRDSRQYEVFPNDAKIPDSIEFLNFELDPEEVERVFRRLCWPLLWTRTDGLTIASHLREDAVGSLMVVRYQQLYGRSYKKKLTEKLHELGQKVLEEP